MESVFCYLLGAGSDGVGQHHQPGWPPWSSGTVKRKEPRLRPFPGTLGDFAFFPYPTPLGSIGAVYSELRGAQKLLGPLLATS